MTLRLLTGSLILCLSVCIARADDSAPRVGISAFAALSSHFCCDAYLSIENLSTRPIMPVLYGTFGNDWSCVDKFIASNQSRPHSLEIHLSNGPCHLNNRCATGEIFPNTSSFRFSSYLERFSSRMISAFKMRTKSVLLHLENVVNENTEVVISLGLEDSYSTRAALNVYAKVREAVLESGVSFPVKFLRNPVHALSFSSTDFIEHHSLFGNCTERTFISNDGSEIELSGINQFYKRHGSCGGIILWLPSLQGFEPNERNFIKPRNRTFKFTKPDKIKAVKFFIGN